MTQQKIRSTILNMLARRDYCQAEILSKLKAKGENPEIIATTITELALTGLLNDQRYICNYIESRRRKGYGPQRIFNELEVKGLPKEMIAEQLKITDNAWSIEVYNVWHKHFKGKMPEDYKTRAKQIRFLQYRGYTQAQINNIFKE